MLIYFKCESKTFRLGSSWKLNRPVSLYYSADYIPLTQWKELLSAAWRARGGSHTCNLLCKFYFAVFPITGRRECSTWWGELTKSLKVNKMMGNRKITPQTALCYISDVPKFLLYKSNMIHIRSTWALKAERQTWASSLIQSLLCSVKSLVLSNNLFTFNMETQKSNLEAYPKG